MNFYRQYWINGGMNLASNVLNVESSFPRHVIQGRGKPFVERTFTGENSLLNDTYFFENNNTKAWYFYSYFCLTYCIVFELVLHPKYINSWTWKRETTLLCLIYTLFFCNSLLLNYLSTVNKILISRITPTLKYIILWVIP